MVQIFNPGQSPQQLLSEQLGAALGQGITQRFPPPQQLVQQRLLQDALEKAKIAVRDPKASPLDKMFSFMQAGAGIPGSERYMGSALPLVMKLAEAEASQRAPFGIDGQPGQEEPSQPGQVSAEQQLNDFLQPPQQNQFYPSNVGAQQQPGNLPQAATSGVKLPVRNADQLRQMAKPYADRLTKAGNPTTVPEAYEILKAQNQDNKEANALVEQERKERVASQREYGNIAEAKLANVMPDAGDEEKAYIKRQVEQLAGENASEADIERLAAGEARKYKNMVSKVSNDISASRSFNRPFQQLMGTSKSAESARNDLRLKIKPLLEAGLYDKARNVLSERGYDPEEREMIISNLGENSEKLVNRMPKMTLSEGVSLKKGFPETVPMEQRYNPQQIPVFKQNLNDVLQADPATNLILLRRKYELEKNVDWRLFKDSINEAIDSGLFKPNDDQFNQLDKLDQPPLNQLEKILHGVGFIGR